MDPEVIEKDPEVDTPEPSLRDTLESAIEEVDPNLDGAEAPAPDRVSAEPVPPQSDKALSAPSPGEPAEKPASSTELKAPAQWKPAVREKWNQLPREVQEEVLRREGDSMRLIGSVGPKIRMADEVQGHLQPFMGVLQENGVHPSSFLRDVFTSIKSLANGSPQERAETVANIVQSYGVDLPMLDRILTARISAPPEVFQARMETARARAVIQGQAQSVEHQNAMEAERTVVAFAADPKHEFIEDVRDMMADLIELGRVTTLDDAYHAAVWAHPATRQILLTREAQQRAAVKTNRAVAARRASSSVRGAPSVPGAAANGASGGSLRDTIAAAFDDAAPL